MSGKLKLYGFNNLTKALSFNIYDVCYAKTAREQKDYIAYIDKEYNSERLTNILLTLTDMIGARVLNVSKQDYEPQGASVTILMAENSMVPMGDTVVSHRCGYLRGDNTAFYTGLSDRLFRLGYHYHGLPGAGLYQEGGRLQAVY